VVVQRYLRYVCCVLWSTIMTSLAYERDANRSTDNQAIQYPPHRCSSLSERIREGLVFLEDPSRARDCPPHPGPGLGRPTLRCRLWRPKVVERDGHGARCSVEGRGLHCAPLDKQFCFQHHLLSTSISALAFPARSEIGKQRDPFIHSARWCTPG